MMDTLFHRHTQIPVGELYHKIEESHLVYLQADEYPVKSEKRRELEIIIERFLCLVPNDNKYVHKETAEILRRSAAEFQEFSGYKASKGWAAIALYASNLFAQPWRKEYKSLKTYCGYYKYEVEANLLGADVMFELMGYERDASGVFVMEGPIDPTKVAHVSRDAIVALVECKILKQIWEQVSNKLDISWLEILRHRETNIGSANTTVQRLNYLKGQESERVQDIYKSHMMPTITHPSLFPKYTAHFSNGLSHHNHNHQPQHAQQNINMNNGVLPSRQFFPLSPLLPQPQLQLVEPKSCKCLSSAYVDKSELFNNFSTSVSIGDYHQQHQDLHQQQQPQQHSINNFFRVNSRVDEIDNRLYGIRGKSISNETFPVSGQHQTRIVEVKQQETLSSEIDKKNINNHRSMVIRRKTNDWNCEYCTFLNNEKVEICDMCGKSRRRGNEDEPLVSGGKECPQCTLINKKDVDKCEACHANLEHSPTYI